MKNIIVLGIALTLLSCKKQPIEPKELCPGGCNSEFVITSNASLQSDGYWHVVYNSSNYFTVEGNLTKLNSQYEVNKVPLVETNFDSDYWVLFDTIQYTIPIYSYLGWFSNNQFTTPLPVGNYIYTLKDIADIHPPLNIVGYQINPHTCWDCPYTETLFGTHSKYTYEPKQNIFFDKKMVGDTASIYIQVVFNSDLGKREIQNKILKVIFE